MHSGAGSPLWSSWAGDGPVEELAVPQDLLRILLHLTAVDLEGGIGGEGLECCTPGLVRGPSPGAG
jgi:hypothetical protein